MIPAFLLPLNRFQSCYIYSRSDPFLMRPFRPRFLHFSVFGFLRVWQPGATDRCALWQSSTPSGCKCRRRQTGSAVLQLGCKCRRRQTGSAVLQLGCKCRRRQTVSLGVAAADWARGPGSCDLAVCGIFLAYQMPLWAFPGASQKRNTKTELTSRHAKKWGSTAVTIKYFSPAPLIAKLLRSTQFSRFSQLPIE